MLEWISEQMTANQFAQGAVMATVLGGIIAYGKQIPSIILNFLRKRLSCSISINDSNDNLKHFLTWCLSQKTFQDIKRINLFARGGNEYLSAFENKGEKFGVPDSGVYFGWIKKRPVWLRVSLSKSQQGVWNWDVSLSSLSFSKKFLNVLYQDFLNSIPDDSKTKMSVFLTAQYDSWEKKKRLRRPISSIFLNGGIKDDIIKDIEWFSNSKDWYINRGLNHKRCYLFASKPGTGKTSLALAIASHFNRDFYVVNFSNYKSDKEFLSAWTYIQENSVVLIDDIDVQNFNISRDDEEKDKLSLSSILNAIDGSSSLSDAVIIITTNKPEVLDEALIRAGRVDKKFFLDYFNVETAIEMANHFLGNQSGLDFVRDNFGIEEGNYIKPAELQGKLMEFTKV